MLKAFQEHRGSQVSERTLIEYSRGKTVSPDAAELTLKDSLFQNKWLPATNVHIEHNLKLIKYLISDCSNQMNPSEKDILGKALNIFEAQNDLIKWRWSLRYIKELKIRLTDLSEKRSIGRFFVG